MIQGEGTMTTTKTDRAIALADRATATLNDWLTTGRKADARKADAAYDEIVEACPTTVEGIAAGKCRCF